MPSRPCLVAVVEDNSELRADLVEFLELKGFVARGFDSAEQFFQVWPALRFDLLLLDVILPGASGLAVAQRVRAQDSVGIIMLTALDTNADHLSGLDAGADVFLSKRSSLEVIEAACLSVLRRIRPDVPVPGGVTEVWRLEIRRWQLVAPSLAEVTLTHAELQVLSDLLDRPGEAVSREALVAGLGKPQTLSNLRNLDNTVSRLRRKVIETTGVELPVRPSYGRGYTFTGRCEVRR